MKINLDKYYTSFDLAKYVVLKTKEIIGDNNISEYFEPSAGQGVFLPFFDKEFKALDIDPDGPCIEKCDYLDSNFDYKKGRLVIGNPPYGKGNYTSVKFFKKSINHCDYISFILPISQLNNNMYMYEFDLIYSEDLGSREYSGILVHCCLNIYSRPVNGFNKKPSFILDCISLKGVSAGKTRNDKIPEKYDFSIVQFGSSIGKKCEYENQYCQQMYITINDLQYKDLISNAILNAKWVDIYKMTATPTLKHWHVYKYLKDQFHFLN